MTIENPKGLSHIDNAERNRKIILNIIKDRGPISRKDVTEVNNLSIATTKRLIENILQDNLAMEVQPSGDVKKRGRKASYLKLNSGYGFSIGISVATRGLSVKVLDFSGDTLLENQVSFTQSDRDSIIKEMRKNIGAAVETGKKKNWGRLFGIGVGIPGLVDASSGIVLFSPVLPDWENVDLRSLLKEQFEAEIVIDDCVRCMALAEKRAGVTKDATTFLYVYVGDGVGSGIFTDNKLFRGSNGIAGELGHITIRDNGPLCRCGNHGCLEALVSINAILRQIDNRLSEKVFTSLKMVFDANNRIELQDIQREAQKGDKLSNMIISETAEYIGIGIADIVNVLDPGTVILGGEVIESFGELLTEGVERSIRLRGIPTITQRTRILKSGIGRNSAAFGAAVLMIENYMGNQIISI